MTPQEYIQEKYRAMGVSLSDGYVSPSDDTCFSEAGGVERVHRAFVESLPEFLLMPSSVSELGVSISRASKDDIAKYYRLECRRLGLPDMLSEPPRVRWL